MKIKLKSPNDLVFLRKSGEILAATLKNLEERARAGVKLSSLDKLARELLQKAGAKPAFLGYKPEGSATPYPAAICASLNDTIVHGLPTNYELKDGDVLKLDLGVIYNGYFTDGAITIGIGEISPLAKKLIETTAAALYRAIGVCQPGNRLGDIGWIIQKTINENGFSVAKGLTGHGVGFELHEDPVIYNYGNRGTGMILEEGMVLAVEPMASAGAGDIRQMADGSFKTSDGSLSAHFEHTVAITADGPEILTRL
jgi:methionyl aminopeptidase